MPLDGYLDTTRPGVVHLRGPVRLKDFVEDEARTTWVELAYVGHWKGHHGGEFTFKRSDFETILRNFRSHENPLPVYYEHISGESWGDGRPKPAAGWILDLDIRPRSNGDGSDALWAKVRFTERGAEHVKAEEYLFSSVEVDFKGRDRVSGEPVGIVLQALALTNEPFLDGQQPLKLSKREAGKPAPKPPKKDEPPRALGRAIVYPQSISFGPRKA